MGSQEKVTLAEPTLPLSQIDAAEKRADGVTGECIVADSGMMRNIVSYQPAVEEYPPK